MTNEPKAGMGLDSEMLAAYIDNRLPPEQRAAVEAQLANDPDAYAVLVETIKALDDGEVPEVRTVPGVPRGAVPTVPSVPTAAILPMPPRVPKTRWVVAGSALAAAAALALVVWLQPEVWQRIRGGEPVDPLMAKLVDAVGEERYIEARLTGGFKYGPLRSVTRGAPIGPDLNPSIEGLRKEWSTHAVKDPSSEHLHALGVLFLITGDVDGAISSLLRSLEARPGDPAVLTDLAAAHVQKARTSGSLSELEAAIESARAALNSDPQLAAAHFNLALGLELSDRPEAAQEAWRTYLSVERDSSWASEGAAHLARVSRRR